MKTGIIEIMKTATLGVMDNAKLADITIGVVVSVNPVRVQPTYGTMVLPSNSLIVPKHLTDYETDISFDDPDVKQVYTTWDMDEKTESSPAKISFKQKQKHKITVYNALKIGDKVALVRAQGGQLFYILDRVE